MKRIRRVLLIGDLAGAANFHVGDEAMLECNLAMLRRVCPGASFSLVSSDPAASAHLYGTQAVPRPGFAAVSADRSAELQRIDAWLALARHQPEQLPEALQELLQADLLVISGGGNLSSTWPVYILERLALVRLARQQGIPVLVLGQTLGPNLAPVDRPLVAEILDAAIWIGLREAGSVALALELGAPLPRIDYQLDDAIGQPGKPVAQFESIWEDSPSQGPLIALTLHPLYTGADRERWLDSVAAELDSVIAELDARVLFVSHLCDQRGGHDGGDHAIGQALAMRLHRPTAMQVLKVQGSSETAWLTQQADLVVSSRYHPLVFALARHRPCLALPTDQYTLTKLQGALMHAGREEDLLVIRDKCWSGLAQRIIERWRMAGSEPLNPQWLAKLQHHGQAREQRLAGCLAAHQAQQMHGSRVDRSDLIQALARLLSGPAQARLAKAREAELRDTAEHWKQSAEAAETYALDLIETLRRSSNESDQLRELLDSTIRRAEIAERYARSLEEERRARHG